MFDDKGFNKGKDDFSIETFNEPSREFVLEAQKKIYHFQFCLDGSNALTLKSQAPTLQSSNAPMLLCYSSLVVKLFVGIIAN